jgi:Saccharopine dehydrogenase and related proteins
MKNIVILGSGSVGLVAAKLLSDTKKYCIHVVDRKFDNSVFVEMKECENFYTNEVDISNTQILEKLLNEANADAVISCLPYFLNPLVAIVAKKLGMNYFDTTEDIAVTQKIREISLESSKAFVPQCGLAPGFVNIVANSMVSNFDELDSIKIRVGALPIAPSNMLRYGLTWSIDGLINEYGNSCQSILGGKVVEVQPLEGLEFLSIEGASYECFNTSGGLGTLAETYNGKIRNMTYKTMRYPGHCQMMRFLMNDLKLNENRELLKKIIEYAIPKIFQDVVVMFITVAGKKGTDYVEENYIEKTYGQRINNKNYTALQLTTAGSLCAVVEKVLSIHGRYCGFIKQENFSLEDIKNSSFGYCFANSTKYPRV